MRAVLSLGANLGDPEAAVLDAVAKLDGVIAVSGLYRTAPWGGIEQPEFVNAIVIVETESTPAELLARTQAIEHAAGRVRDVRWGPRTLDIDVITCDDIVSDDPMLTLPHPRAHERAFVLVPWLELDPDAVIPGHGRADELLVGIADQEVSR